MFNFSTETGKLGTNDIETYVPVDQIGDKPSSISNDAIHEEESESANCECPSTNSAASDDNFKHPASTV